MAELPAAFFPEALRLEGMVKEDFSNYGHNGSVLVSGLRRSDMAFQYNHPGKEHNLGLSAIAPTLPLSKSPARVVNMYEDRMMQQIQKQREIGMRLLRKLSRGKGLIKTKRCGYFRDSVQVLRQWLEEYRMEPEASSYPDWFTALDDLVQQLPPSGYVPKVNTNFYGGCVSAFQTGGRLGVLHASDVSFDKLSVALVSGSPEEEGGDRVLRRESVSEEDMRSPIFQIHSQVVGHTVTACVSTTSSCSMFSVAWDDRRQDWRPRLLEVQGVGRDTVTSVSVSPYIPGESLVVTNTGSMYIWNAGKSFQQVLDQEAPRFRCLEPWRHGHYGAHPRQVVLTDQTCVQLFDNRSPLRGGSLDIFALPDKLVKPHERIFASAHHPAWPFCHLVTTDQWLFVLDQRFPRHPVLQWQHMLEQPPQYLSVLDYSPGQSLALAACQHRPEVTAFPFLHSGGPAPVSSHLQPWRLSPFREFRCLGEAEGGCSRLVQQRLGTSLAGLAACPGLEPGTLATFQMDSFGEVYHQVYGPQTAHTRDKTGRQGDSSLWRGRAGRWLEAMDQQLLPLQAQHLHGLKVSSGQRGGSLLAAAGSPPPGQCVLCREEIEASREEDMDTSFDLLEVLTRPDIPEASEMEAVEDGPPMCQRCRDKVPKKPPLQAAAETESEDGERGGWRGGGEVPAERLQVREEGEAALLEQLLREEDYLTSAEAEEDLNSQLIYLQYHHNPILEQLLPLRAEQMEKKKNDYLEAVWKDRAERQTAESDSDEEEEGGLFSERVSDGDSPGDGGADSDRDMETGLAREAGVDREAADPMDSEAERGSQASCNVGLLIERLVEFERSCSQGSSEREASRSPSLF